MSITITANCCAADIWLWAKKVRIFLDPLTRKLYGKYVAKYLKRYVGGSPKTLEIYKMHEVYDVKFIKLGRLRWAGHVMWREESNSAKTVPCTKAGVNGDRKRDRPKLRRCDALEEEVTQVRCRNWRMNVLSREKWQKLTEEMRAVEPIDKEEEKKKNCNAAWSTKYERKMKSHLLLPMLCTMNRRCSKFDYFRHLKTLLVWSQICIRSTEILSLTLNILLAWILL